MLSSKLKRLTLIPTSLMLRSTSDVPRLPVRSRSLSSMPALGGVVWFLRCCQSPPAGCSGLLCKGPGWEASPTRVPMYPPCPAPGGRSSPHNSLAARNIGILVSSFSPSPWQEAAAELAITSLVAIAAQTATVKSKAVSKEMPRNSRCPLARLVSHFAAEHKSDQSVLTPFSTKCLCSAYWRPASPQMMSVQSPAVSVGLRRNVAR